MKAYFFSLKLLPRIGIALLAAGPLPSWGDESARPAHPTELKTPTQDRFVYVPGCEVAFADYEALRRDFKELREWTDAEINQWIVKEHGFISEGQLQLNGLRNTAIPVDPTRTKTGYRPPRYARGAVLETGFPDGGLVDEKGVGHRPQDALMERLEALKNLFLESTPEGFQSALDQFRVKDHSDGLMSFGEAVAEFTRQSTIQMLFDLHNQKYGTNYQTVETYFILYLPFEIEKKHGEKISAAIYGRQAHYDRRSVSTRKRPPPKGIFDDPHGGFQSTTLGTSIDFGGAIIEDPRLQANFGGIGDSKDPQMGKPWVWGHQVAQHYRRTHDPMVVQKHFLEMVNPILAEWRGLPVAKSRQTYSKPFPKSANVNPAAVLDRIPPPHNPKAENYDSLLKALNDPDPWIHERTARLIPFFQGPKTYDLLLFALKHPKIMVRKYAALSMWSYSGPRKHDLLKFVLNDPSPPLRQDGFLALSQLSETEAVDLYLSALKESKTKSEELFIFIGIIDRYSKSPAILKQAKNALSTKNDHGLQAKMIKVLDTLHPDLEITDCMLKILHGN